MKDKVFIGWSGSNEVAMRVKRILENEYNYICYIGGNSDNNSTYSSIGDTVIQQIKTCNQAIVIFQNKANGVISNNLFFELGYVLAKYGAKKIHCVRKASETVVLPSDFDNAFVEPIACENDDEFAHKLIEYFLARQKMSIDENKMLLINNRYRIHDIIQSHYSENGSRCSDYELAQYILFYMQAAHMFGDEKTVAQELSDFKRTHHYEFSTELGISVNLCLSFFEMLEDIAQLNGTTCIDARAYKRFADSCEDLMEDLVADDAGTFDEWARVFVSEQLTYATMLFAGHPDNDEELQNLLYEKCVQTAKRTLEYVDVLEKSTPCKENNDSIGLVSIFKSYVYRNIYVSYNKLGEPTYMQWLQMAKKERKALLRNFAQGSIDTKLFANFEMEYYLVLAELLLLEDKTKMDKFELKMSMDELKRYLQNVEQEDERNIYVDQIGLYYEQLKLA